MSKKKSKKVEASEFDTLASKIKRETLESRLRILKMIFEIPLITTAIIIGLDKIL